MPHDKQPAGADAQQKVQENGSKVQNGSTAIKLQVWSALAQYLPSRTAEYDFWWQLTGRHLAVLFEAAEYPIEKQYEALIFHYHWAVPYMGPAPGADGIIPGKWKSLLQADGTPIEYSWKWNSSNGRPEVRYAMEPIGPYAGTELDPLNQQATREVLYRMAQVIPSVNLKWSNHFFATLFDHDNAKFAQEAAAGVQLTTSTGFGVDFGPAGPALKTYFQGRKHGNAGFMTVEEWVSSMRPLLVSDPSSKSSNGSSNDEGALSAMLEFLASHPEGTPLKPFSLAVDCITPEKSRMKLYMNTPHTSFDSVRAIMTLGGRTRGDIVESQLEDLREAIHAVLRLPDDFPDDAETEQSYHKDSLSAAAASAPVQNGQESSVIPKPGGENGNEPLPPAHTPGFVYYFDVAPGQTLPDIKLNIPLRSYGRDDLGSARGLVSWLEEHDRGAYGESYIKVLEEMASIRGKDKTGLDQTRGLQSFISFAMSRSGELGINSYLAVRGSDGLRPDPARMAWPARRRGTRRRDE